MQKSYADCAIHIVCIFGLTEEVFSQTLVVRHPIEHPTHIQASMTLPTRPHAIFSTLQGTQNPDTKPTLQRAKNANAQPTHPG